ncbi:MAG: hypothetical protein M0R80_05975 [Proteobacteria bacterium]|jgi:hypothetical protein|nr:hypothetical protein [Pseudomonadota bacterium]
MRTERILTLALLAALAALAATACDYEEEETSPCEYYCQAAGECHVASDQMFSATECMRTCQTSFERHSSVGCQSPYIELIECMVDLPCQSWNDYGAACAAQIDYLDTCVEGTTY